MGGRALGLSMPDIDDPSTTPVPYKKSSDRRYFEALSNSIETTVEDDEDVIKWTCPRCDHVQTRGYERDTVLSMLVGTPSSGDPKRVRVPLECDCGQDHPGRTDGSGCGYGATATFLV